MLTSLANQLDPGDGVGDVRRLPLLAWTERYRARLGPGITFDLTGHRYLRALYQEDRREVAVMKSGQAGVSEWLISYAFHCCDVRNMNVLYLLPTLSDLSDFSRMRFGTAVEASSHLRSLVTAPSQSGKKGTDQVGLKRVRDRFIVMRGTQVQFGNNGEESNTHASRLKSMPADSVIYDEFDEMSSGIEGLATMRLGHSPHKEQRFVSTPTYPGFGIHAKFTDSTAAEWFIRCKHCGERQELTIDHIVTEWDTLRRPKAWRTDESGTPFCGCRRCGKTLDRLGEGEWVEAYPGREVAGYHITKLATAQTALADILTRLQDLNEHKRQQTYNQDLGLPYRPRGGGLDDEALGNCLRPYAHGPRAHVKTVMGIDVGRALHVVIRTLPTENGERAQLWAGELSDFDEAVKLIERYGVVRCVVDALPETRQARLFQKALPAGKVWLAYYAIQSQGTKVVEPTIWKDDEGTVDLDRTRILDETFARFLNGQNTLPANVKAAAPTYYAHLKAPVRVTRKRADDIMVASYIETGPDHFAHAEAYCAAASLAPAPSAGSMDSYMR